MAETVKKTKAAAREKKSTTKSKKTEETESTAVSAKPRAKANGIGEKVTLRAPARPKKSAAAKVSKVLDETQTPSPSREQIAQLAHRFWTERGRHHGSHEQDWLRAERELRGMAS